MNSELLQYDLNLIARPMSSEAPVHTLFRYPGPCGLRDLSHGTLKTLAPDNLATVFLFKNRYAFYHQGIETFGIFAVANDAHLSAVCLDDEALKALNYVDSDRGRIFLGYNKPVTEETHYVWLPPELYNAEEMWGARPFNEVRELTQTSTYKDKKMQAFAEVNSYMEEAAQIEAALGKQSLPWYLQSPEERKMKLASAQLSPRWSLAR